MKSFYRNLLVSALLAAGTASYASAATLADAIGETAVYGYFINSSTGEVRWEKLSTDGAPSVVWSVENATDSFVMTDGWMKDNALCGPAIYSNSSGWIGGVCYETLNPFDGEVINRQNFSPYNNTFRFSSAVYSPADDTIYGYGMNPDAANYPAWKKAPGNGDFNQVEYILTLSDPYSWCPSICIDDETEEIFGITFKNKFMKLGKDGSQTELFALDVKAKGNNTGLAYIPSTGKFLWSTVLSDGSNALYVIDTEARTAEAIDTANPDGYYAFFSVGDAAACIDVPESPVVKEVLFEEGAVSGSVEIIMPTMTLPSDEIVGDLTWIALLDGVKYSEGVSTPGKSVTIDFSGLSNAMHTFAFKCIYKGKTGLETSFSRYIGNDVPLSPAYVTLTLDGNTLTADWKAVEKGVHNAYLDLSKMKYEVWLNDVLMCVTSDTSWTHTIDLSIPYSAYKVAVCAECNDLKSDMRNSNFVAAGSSLDLTYSIAPTAEEAALMTYITDSYGTRWKFDADLSPAAFTSGYYADGPVDDWLITPPLNFSVAGGKYEVAFKVDAYRDYWGPWYEVGEQEYYDLWLGKSATADGMVMQLIDKTKVEDEEVDMAVEFTVEEAGTYFVGFHGQSAANNPGLTIRDIKISCKSSVGVDAIAGNALSVKGGKGCILISGLNGKQAQVFSFSGACVASVDADTSVTLDKGVYVVKVDEKSLKVFVK